jgi:hypothetical protein
MNKMMHLDLDGCLASFDKAVDEFWPGHTRDSVKRHLRVFKRWYFKLKRKRNGYTPITRVASMAFDCIIFSLPPPCRHSELWLMMFKHVTELRIGQERRGFIDKSNLWLNREGGYYRAQKTGKIKTPIEWSEEHPGKLKPGNLYSEDLW